MKIHIVLPSGCRLSNVKTVSPPLQIHVIGDLLQLSGPVGGSLGSTWIIKKISETVIDSLNFILHIFQLV